MRLLPAPHTRYAAMDMRSQAQCQHLALVPTAFCHNTTNWVTTTVTVYTAQLGGKGTKQGALLLLLLIAAWSVSSHRH